jgi:hypothetical protein
MTADLTRRSDGMTADLTRRSDGMTAAFDRRARVTTHLETDRPA